ncbi:hypothetical protein HAP48_0042550 [Bradyrhizobium septentrionale]|uniref:Uncharacterized protein n=1 Tax=Bradyrhizobium septentrionale TaxID=1404411 RepID=A0A974A1K1_9BRAD|nr:hypothetical protein [Bradyrhizobium septentrionale]UGY15140.1 hypothetical protein HAP48_0042550 [Bradyrhizobium septentrionale]
MSRPIPRDLEPKVSMQTVSHAVQDALIKKALQLRARGKTMQEVADEIGVTRLDVFRMFQRQ